MAWPSPENVTLRLDVAKSHIALPILDATAGLAGVRFENPEYAKPGPVTVINPAHESRKLQVDVETQQALFDIRSDDGRYIIDEIGTEVASTRNKVYEVGRDDPASAKTSVLCSHSYRRGTWNARVETAVIVTSDTTHFHITGTVKAFENDGLFETRDFSETIPRDHM